MSKNRGLSHVVERLERRVLLSLSPVGGEFHVNTFTTGSQWGAAVAMDGDGDFVTAWHSYGQDGSGYGIYAQRYSAGGAAQGGEFRVNTWTTHFQARPAVAMDADGDFVIAWQSYGQDGSYWGVYAQRYNSLLLPQGLEFRVNTWTTGGQGSSSIAMDADGDFVIAWHSTGQDGSDYGIYAQRYNAAGVAQGAEFRVNTYTTNHQHFPAIGMDADGDFVVAWMSDGQDGSGYGVYAQRYNAAGVAQGSEFRVNSYTTNSQRVPAIGMDADGDFVVAWDSAGQDGDSFGIYAQRYNAAGVPQGSEFRVNTFATSIQSLPAAAMDANGDFVIAWSSYGHQDGSGYGVYAQRYNAVGAAQGEEFRVNSFTTDQQWNASVAMDAEGDVVVVWDSAGQDGDSYGIYAQRFEESAPDTAGPMIGGAFVNEQRLRPYLAITPAMQSIVVSFSENLTDAGGASGVNSVTNPANWMLTRNGIDLTPTITSIGYGLNFGTNRHEATLTLSAVQASGNFLLTARDSLRDIAGNALDGDFDGVPGGNFLMPFSVVGPGTRGPEFRVNTWTTNGQRFPAVAMDADGDFVVAWHSDAQDGDGYGVYAQRYNAAGVAQGDEFLVNTFTTDSQSSPSVAMDADGDFVVAWTSDAQDGSGFGVYAQRYSAAGVAQGDEFRVNTWTTSHQSRPSVAMDADGDFVIAWHGNAQDGSSDGVYAQRYSAAGMPQGAEFRVNTWTTNMQWLPSVAMDADGDFVIAWRSFGQDGSNSGVYAQRYDAAGVRQGGEFRVNTFTTNSQSFPSVGMDADGDFVVAWMSYGQDGSSYGVYAQRYNAAGVRQGEEFHVNTYTTSRQSRPSVAMDADGDFVISWHSGDFSGPGQDGSSYGVYAQRYNAAGAAQDTEFQVNAYTTSFQLFPAVAMDADGDFVVAWDSSGQDGSQYGVYAQRYTTPSTPSVGSLTDSPDPVMAGASITLAASSILGESPITGVSFYRETNGLPGLQVGAGGDTLVGTSTAPISGFWSINLSTAGLGAGTYTYWAQATDGFGLTGMPASTTNTVTGGATVPVVTASSFLFETAPQRLSFIFSQNVGASLGLNDIIVQTLPGGPSVTPTGVSYDAATNTATFSFTGIIPDGNYRATLLAAGITSPGGTPMTQDHAFDFFVLAGDANRDRKVDVADLGILASNWQQSGRTFSQGNFDYTTNGLVDVADLGILASAWQKELAAAAPAFAPPVKTPRSAPTRVATLVL